MKYFLFIVNNILQNKCISCWCISMLVNKKLLEVHNNSIKSFATISQIPNSYVLKQYVQNSSYIFPINS